MPGLESPTHLISVRCNSQKRYIAVEMSGTNVLVDLCKSFAALVSFYQSSLPCVRDDAGYKQINILDARSLVGFNNRARGTNSNGDDEDIDKTTSKAEATGVDSYANIPQDLLKQVFVAYSIIACHPVPLHQRKDQRNNLHSIEDGNSKGQHSHYLTSIDRPHQTRQSSQRKQ